MVEAQTGHDSVADRMSPQQGQQQQSESRGISRRSQSQGQRQTEGSRQVEDDGRPQGDQHQTREDGGPETPEVATPVLDASGQRSQRTVEQKQKQEELIRVDARMKGLETNRSRSPSRRARRRRVQKDQREGKYMLTNSLTALEEADASNEVNGMQSFERIGPDSTSMDGPVTMARADRGEIPVRGTDPSQPYYKKPADKENGKLKNTDGLKLTLEANLDVEIELKASIRGDVTLSLL